jgi:hypothetical protein
LKDGISEQEAAELRDLQAKIRAINFKYSSKFLSFANELIGYFYDNLESDYLVDPGVRFKGETSCRLISNMIGQINII